MARVWQLLLRADGDTKNAERELKKLSDKGKKFGQGMRNMGAGLTAGVTMPLVGFAAVGIQELRETMEVTKKTDAVFASMGDSMKVTKKDLNNLVGELENYSAIEGDIIQNAANVGLTFDQLAGNPELFKKTTRAAVDMSAALGMDVQQSVTMLGKAMQNGAKGAAALGKNGTLAKADIEKLQKMAKDGVPLWKQQEFILKAVNKQYAGQGKNVDPIKAVTVAVKNLAEDMAVMLMPAIESVTGVLLKFTGWVSKLNEKQKKWLGIALLIAAAIGPVLMVVGQIVIGVSALIPIIAGISLAMVGWGLVIAAVVAALVYAYVKSETFRDKVNAAFNAVKDGVMEVVDALKETIMQWAEWAEEIWTNHSDKILEVVNALWDAITGVIGGALRVIKNIVLTALALLRGDWDGAWRAIKNAFIALWDTMKSIVQLALTIIKTVLQAAWNAIKYVAQVAWNGIKTVFRVFWDWFKTKVTESVNNAKTRMSNAWATIKNTAAVGWRGIKNTLASVLNWIPGKVQDIMTSIKTRMSNAWGAIKERASDAWGAIKTVITGKIDDLPGKIIGFFASLPEKLANVGKEAGQALGNALKAAVNAVLDRVRNISLPKVSFMGKEVGGGKPFSGIPRLADGGIINRPTMALVGEAGAEAVIPLGGTTRNVQRRQQIMQQSGLAAMTGSGTTINVYPSSGDPEAIAQRVAMMLKNRRTIIGGGF
jgi:phage-related protein